MLGVRSIKNCEKVIYTAKSKIEYAKKLLNEVDPLSARAQKIAFDATHQANLSLLACERCRKYLYRITKSNKIFKQYKSNYEFHQHNLFEDISYIKEKDRPTVKINTAAYEVEFYAILHIEGYKKRFYQIFKGRKTA